MSAERLREAARLMRERAKVGDPLGYPSPWASTPDPSAIDGRHEVLCHEDGSGLVADDIDAAVAEHIASWHPDVGVVVADWLDAMGALAPPDPHHEGERCETCENVRLALAVADAYLGGSS